MSTKRITIAALSAVLVGAISWTGAGTTATAKEDTLVGAAAAGGVAFADPPHPGYRYLAISPHVRHPVTVVERIRVGDGRVDRWWYLRGAWMIPAGSYDLGGTGLSGDGGTLVLAADANGRYRIDGGRPEPPRVTRFAVLDTEVRLRTQNRPDGVTMAHAIRRIRLRGRFEVSAVSADGSTAYLAQYLRQGPERFGRPGDGLFQVRALDTVSGRLRPAPLRTGSGARPRLAGVPITRSSSGDGRWSYALYFNDGRKLFLLALDTAAGTIARVDLHGVEYGRDPFGLRLHLAADGHALSVFHHTYRGANSPTLARVHLPIRPADEPAPERRRFLGFLFTPRGPGNLLGRTGSAGRSSTGREIEVHQWGDPRRPAVLVFGAGALAFGARKLEPRFVLSAGCPDPAANIVLVHGIDRSESRLAAAIVRTVAPRVTIWFRQHTGPGAFVRGWGEGAAAGHRFAALAGIPFHRVSWPDRAAPHRDSSASPVAGSFVVSLPPGALAPALTARLGETEARLAHMVGEDGYVFEG